MRLAAIVAALSQALDLSTGQPPGHSVRACLLGMRIAEEVGVSPQGRSDLFYAMLLKDCGCSGNASKIFHALAADDLKAKREVKTTDWTRMSWETLQYALTNVAPGKPFLERSRALFRLALNQKTHTRDVTKIRCERGARLADLMGLSPAIATAILNLDEHWNGEGQPDGFIRLEIPLLSRIMLLAQTLEIFLMADGSQVALEVVNRRSGRWFEPDLVNAVNSLNRRDALFHHAFADDMTVHCLQTEPQPKFMKTGDSSLDRICTAFAEIVDAKSPYTFNHSLGVANAAVATARMLGLPRHRVIFLRNAALLHDLGKVGVSNTILEKPGKLNEAEWRIMKGHPFQTWRILRTIPGFEEMSEVAGSHHEKVDGSGYFRGLHGEHLSLESRILTVADVFDGLSAKRPYRDGLPHDQVFKTMRLSTPHQLDAACIEALEQSGAESNQSFVNLQNLNDQLLSAGASYSIRSA